MPDLQEQGGRTAVVDISPDAACCICIQRPLGVLPATHMSATVSNYAGEVAPAPKEAVMFGHTIGYNQGVK